MRYRSARLAVTPAEHVVDAPTENARDPEREFERRGVAIRFERYDGLAHRRALVAFLAFAPMLPQWLRRSAVPWP